MGCVKIPYFYFDFPKFERKYFLNVTENFIFSYIRKRVGWRVVSAPAPAAPRSSLCGVVGSSPTAARSRGSHTTGVSVTVVIVWTRNCTYICMNEFTGTWVETDQWVDPPLNPNNCYYYHISGNCWLIPDIFCQRPCSENFRLFFLTFAYFENSTIWYAMEI